jgi:hypothetical protein
MNKERRKRLEIIADKLYDLISETTIILSEEGRCMENTPENMQGSERHEKAEENCDALSEAIEHMENAHAYIKAAAL